MYSVIVVAVLSQFTLIALYTIVLSTSLCFTVLTKIRGKKVRDILVPKDSFQKNCIEDQ